MRLGGKSIFARGAIGEGKDWCISNVHAGTDVVGWYDHDIITKGGRFWLGVYDYIDAGPGLRLQYLTEH